MPADWTSVGGVKRHFFKVCGFQGRKYTWQVLLESRNSYFKIVSVCIYSMTFSGFCIVWCYWVLANWQNLYFNRIPNLIENSLLKVCVGGGTGHRAYVCIWQGAEHLPPSLYCFLHTIALTGTTLSLRQKSSFQRGTVNAETDGQLKMLRIRD